MMDKCHYCGRQYHPMPVYTRLGRRIYVCHFRVENDTETGEIEIVDTDCREQAKLEGYEYRRNLTPRR
jgi:hypothetical protein